MAGEISKESLGCVALLKTLSREEILEVLSQGLCEHCDAALQTRIESLAMGKDKGLTISNNSITKSYTDSPIIDKSKQHHKSLIKPAWGPRSTPASVFSTGPNGFHSNLSPTSVNSKESSPKQIEVDISLNDGLSQASPMSGIELSEEQDQTRFAQVGRKKDFSCIERINGKSVNVLQGLELHTKVFNSQEQRMIVEYVFQLQRMGQNGQLRERTYSEPKKWMRGKGRATIQFGCCYNYAVDKDGNPPGIIREGKVDPLPPLFKQIIKRMVRWHVLPPARVPDSCIVNIYEEGDCIPPHIDHHDFIRPFCTVSFLSECNIIFGANLKIAGPGEFTGPVSIPLPIGSVLILNGNGADVAKHCVPGVPFKRISITFRKMDHSKLPHMHVADPELTGIKPLTLMKSSIPQGGGIYEGATHDKSHVSTKTTNKVDSKEENEFPPLSSLNFGNKQRRKRDYF